MMEGWNNGRSHPRATHFLNFQVQVASFTFSTFHHSIYPSRFSTSALIASISDAV